MNLFELFVKIGVDDQASGKLSRLSSSLGKGLATAAKIGTAAVGAASAAIVALTTQAVNNFAEYEQLAGGAQKIFDEMDFSRISRDAQSAYLDLGMSANQYLAVINDVGATFAATMGDEAGYNTARQGLKAIADYASGTGKDVDELSQKFTLITRSTSSYQSIADQFSGILPATSAEFLKQAQAAGILSDSYKSLTEVPIDEYQAAVSAMLEKGVQDLGLANNAANEAATTISGSLAALKASWSNLVTGLADDNADFDKLMDNFVESAVNVTKNIAPAMGKALNGIGKLIKKIVPVAMEYIPQIIGDFLPTIAEAAIGIVSSIGSAIFDNIDQILEWGQEMLDALFDGIIKNTGNISSVVSKVIKKFGKFVIENLPEIIIAGISILGALARGIIEAIPELAGAAIEAVVEFAAYLIGELARIVGVGEDVVNSIRQGISNAWSGLVSWFNGIWNSLFGNRSVNVNVNGAVGGAGGGAFSGGKSFVNGSHALGLDYVPFDGYVAELHKGERVLTAKEAEGYSGGITIGNISINVNGANYSDENELAEAIAERLQSMTERKAAVYA